MHERVLASIRDPQFWAKLAIVRRVLDPIRTIQQTAEADGHPSKIGNPYVAILLP